MFWRSFLQIVSLLRKYDDDDDNEVDDDDDDVGNE